MIDPRRLVGGWATDSLTQAERRELLRAALDDQALFDELLAEEGLREVLEDPVARQEVLGALDRPGRWERLRLWLARPATVADLATVAAALVVALAAHRALTHREPLAPPPAAARPAAGALSPLALARLADLPARDTGLASLALEGQATARVGVSASARVVLLERRPDGSTVQRWPAAGTALVTPGEPLRVPAAPPPQPGTHRLRLVAAPADLDLAALPPAGIGAVSARLTLLDLAYEVPHP